MEDSTRLFADVRVGVVGGDRRQHEIIRNLVGRGAHVKTYGVPAWDAPDDVVVASTAFGAVEGAALVVLPVPSFLRDDIVFAPESPSEIRLDERFVEHLREGSVLAVSKLLPGVAPALERRSIDLCPMGADDVMQVHHAIPTAEGALRITIERTDFTIFGAKGVVIGFGRVAQSMARALKGLGAHVTVVARREEARARAHAEGFGAVGLDALHAVVAEADLIYNTVPVAEPLVDRSVLEHVRAGALVMDLASPPGGVDQAAAEALGVPSVWARAQAGSAPRYAGWAQYQVIERHMASRSRVTGALHADG